MVRYRTRGQEVRRWGDWEARSHSCRHWTCLRWWRWRERLWAPHQRVRKVQWQRCVQGHDWGRSCKKAALSFPFFVAWGSCSRRGLRWMSAIYPPIHSVACPSTRPVIEKAFEKCVGWNILNEKKYTKLEIRLADTGENENTSSRGIHSGKQHWYWQRNFNTR